MATEPSGCDGGISAAPSTSWGAQPVKNLPAMWEIQVWSLGREDPHKGMATHSNNFAWRIPWTEDPGELQSIELQKVRHNWVTNTYTTHTHCFHLPSLVNVKIHLFLKEE